MTREESRVKGLPQNLDERSLLILSNVIDMRRAAGEACGGWYRSHG
jgi:hypothetical protein